MASRQDRLAAYQFTRGRLVSALVTHDSDPPRPPFRGAGTATLVGVLIAAVATGAIAAWARFTGPDPVDWRDPGALIVEEETGARYLWREPRLHPVVNYTSALLALGSRPRTLTVPQSALNEVPRAPAIGVPGLPDTLPAAEDLVRGAWHVCASRSGGGVAALGEPSQGPSSVVFTGSGPDHGSRLGERGVLAREPGGARHLIWRGRRHAIRDPEVTMPALGWAGASAVPVTPGLLAALPSGPDLARVDLPAAGEPSAAVPGAPVGRVFEVESRSGGPQYLAVLPDGVAPLTPLQADLLLADPRVAAASDPEPYPLPAAELATLPRVDATSVPAAGLPATAPTLVPAHTRSVCVVVPDLAEQDGADRMVLVRRSAAPPLVPAATATATATGSPSGAGADDGIRVRVPPGRALVVTDGGATHLVGDRGARHRAPPGALDRLGYGGVAPVRMPAAVVSLLPEGPSLEPDAHQGG